MSATQDNKEWLAHCSDFELYLRTGWQIVPSHGTLSDERKFNPWHDPEDGRFTFSGTGRLYPADHGAGGFGGGGSGGGGATGSWDQPEKRKKPEPRRQPTSRPPSKRQVRVHGRAEVVTPERPTPVIEANSPRREAQAGAQPVLKPSSSPGSGVEEPMRPKRYTIAKNGYRFEVDPEKRTRKVEGELRLSPKTERSRRSQTEAGGVDRRQSDDGGHYIAARFSGPKESFNHFAQDANFNRGAYRELERQWAKEIARGSRVKVKMIPYYEGGSIRPTSLHVMWEINGKSYTKRFSNEPGGQVKMYEDKLTMFGDLYNKIGQELINMVGDDADSIFLQASAGDGWVGAAIFKEFDDHVQYFNFNENLAKHISELWEGEEPSRRWAIMEYELKDGRFTVDFKFPDDIPPDETEVERRAELESRRYSDKPVRYDLR